MSTERLDIPKASSSVRAAKLWESRDVKPSWFEKNSDLIKLALFKCLVGSRNCRLYLPFLIIYIPVLVIQKHTYNYIIYIENLWKPVKYYLSIIYVHILSERDWNSFFINSHDGRLDKEKNQWLRHHPDTKENCFFSINFFTRLKRLRFHDKYYNLKLK